MASDVWITPGSTTGCVRKKPTSSPFGKPASVRSFLVWARSCL